ncbi:MAG: FAD-dependent pyridine nucleotide-disulfide oxidoreductase [Solirubrobacterales bacterium]|jgi:3-phenylpropionate/trans-cinnamate dioxygenase ferredoxin reductase subunit|nr:FAD-dependent pyridine nucleotide-disulfide oxidoreductase [Solirubrobacterales bacterium]
MTRRTVAIIGASLAGANAAVTLRDEGFDGEILLVGEEPELPYERPPMSKQYLSGEQPFESTLIHPAELYRERDIELRLGTSVTAVDARERAVVLADGSRLRADAILVATGARSRRPPIPGLELAGIHDLRSRADADALRGEIAPGRRAVIAGMGFIGCEVASVLRAAGVDVVAIEASSTPLERVLGPEVGRVIADMHAEHGVELVLGEGVQSFEGEDRVRAVRTTTGRVVECDFVVAGFGAQPNVEFLEGTGVELANGVVVDAFCRSSVEGIYAAGDVALHEHPLFGEHIRVEHWRNAIRQGAAAARSILGKGTSYDELHWFWSDQYDTNIQFIGHHHDWDELVVRGSLQERRFVAFYVKDGVPQSAVAVNMARDLRRATELLRARQPVDVALLRDPDSDLRKVASA